MQYLQNKNLSSNAKIRRMSTKARKITENREKDAEENLWAQKTQESL